MVEKHQEQAHETSGSKVKKDMIPTSTFQITIFFETIWWPYDFMFDIKNDGSDGENDGVIWSWNAYHYSYVAEYDF